MMTRTMFLLRFFSFFSVHSAVKCVNAVFEEFDNGICNKDCKETCR